jgi:hypothetical protein
MQNFTNTNFVINHIKNCATPTDMLRMQTDLTSLKGKVDGLYVKSDGLF